MNSTVENFHSDRINYHLVDIFAKKKIINIFYKELGFAIMIKEASNPFLPSIHT